eukprot:3596678-Alexandrium_andersonii.AAC.1
MPGSRATSAMTLRRGQCVPRRWRACLGAQSRRSADSRINRLCICRPGCKATTLALPPVSSSNANE